MSSIFAVLIGVALAGLIGALYSGLFAGDPFRAGAAEKHRLVALAGAFLVLLAHSVVFIYMIGTGRAIKDAVRDHGVPRELYYQLHWAYKWRAAPWALSCTVLIVATAVLGGVVDSAQASAWIHPILAILCLLANLVGLPTEWRAIRDNGLLLERVAEETAARNRKLLDRGLDPAPPASPFGPASWSVILAFSALLPWLYLRFVMGRNDVDFWPFGAICGLFLAISAFLVLSHRRPRARHRRGP